MLWTTLTSSEAENWCMRVQRKTVQDSEKWCVLIWRNDWKSCKHGESETRMQYTMTRTLQKLGDEKAAQTTVLQVSKDSDNVCLALLGVLGEAMERAHNLIVKMGQKYFDIRRLRSAIENANIRPF